MRKRRESFGVAFNRLWLASLASNVADGLFKTAVPLLAAVLTRDPVLIASLGAVVMLPWLLFAIPIGTVVDRVDRKSALAFANAVRVGAGAVLSAAIIGGWVSFWLLCLVAFVIGIAEVLYDTTAQALVPTLLEPKHLERANSRLEVGGLILGEMIGTPLSGVLFVAAVAIPFVAGNVGILIAFVLVLMIAGSHKSTRDQSSQKTTTMLADMKFGIRYLYENKTLLKIVLFTTLAGFWFSATGSTIVLFLLDTLNVPTAFFGLVMLANAVGSIFGGIFAPKLSAKFGRMNIMAIGLVASGLCALAAGFAGQIWIWIIFQVLDGAAITLWNILLMSTYHQIIPNELFGRIHGTRRTLVWGVMPIGAIVGGLLAKSDLRAPMIVGGALVTVIALLGVPFIRSLSNLVNEKLPSEQQSQE